MKSLINKIKGSKFIKALAVLTSGSVVGSVFIAIYQILQPRVFTADEIGIYTYLLAIPITFISVMSLRYDVAIITEKDFHRSLALVKLSMIINIVLSVLISVLYGIYIIFFKREYIGYIYVIPFVFLILAGYGITNVLTSFNNRAREYKLISVMYVIRTFIQHFGALFLGIILVNILGHREFSVFAMVMPYGVGLFAGVFKQAKGLLKYKEEIKSISREEMLSVAGQHRRQPLVSTPAIFINNFSFSVISIIIENLFNTTILGYYSVSNKVLGMPISLVGGNVAKVFIEQASVEYRNTGKFIKAYKQSLLFLTAVAVPMFFGMYFLAPPLCELFFGSGWGQAGEYIKILAPMFSFRLIGTAISQSLVVCSKQKSEIIFDVLLTVASIGSGIVTGIFGKDITFFLQMLCITRSLAYIWLIIIVYKYSKGDNVK